MESLLAQLDAQRRKVDFDTYDMSVQQLLAMVSQKQINIAPEYQRHFRWTIDLQSQFVESVFLGIPVPSLFMATNADGTWEVVDGVQRLSTLIHFAGGDAERVSIGLSGSLALKDLQKVTTLNGVRFKDLPVSVQTQFLLRPIKIVTLSDKSDLVVRFDLFERLNTGGIRLSNQEIRACVFRGTFNGVLEELAQDRAFLTVLRLPQSRKRDRTQEECVLRYFAFLGSYLQFEHSVVEFLNGYMNLASKSFDYRRSAELFHGTFTFLANAFPDGLRRRGRGNTPINLFEGVAVGAGLALRDSGRIARPRDFAWIDGPDLDKFTRAGTNLPSRVRGRIEYCATKFGWRMR